MKRNVKAIIVAAGIGSRLMKVTQIPKCMITNKSNISVLDTIINSLNNAGLNESDIIVVSGYQHSLLCDHINGRTRIIHNDSYYCTNNFTSFKLGFTDFINNSVDNNLFVIDADTVIHDSSVFRNFLELNTENKSHALLTSRYKIDEWYYLTDSSDLVTRIFKHNPEISFADETQKKYDSSRIFTSTGLTYFNCNDIHIINNILREIHVESTNNYYSYWDDVFFHNLDRIKLYRFDITDLTSEIDSVKDYEMFINSESYG